MGCGSSSQKPVPQRQVKSQDNGQAGTTENGNPGSDSTDNKENENNNGTTSNSQVNLQVEPDTHKAEPTPEGDQGGRQRKTTTTKPARSAPPVEEGVTLATYSSRNGRVSNNRAQRNLAAHTSRNENVPNNYGKRKLSKYSSRNEQISTPSVKRVKEPVTKAGTMAYAGRPTDEPTNEQRTENPVNGQPASGQDKKDVGAPGRRQDSRAERNRTVPSSRNQKIPSSYGKRNLSNNAPRNQRIITPCRKKNDDTDGKGPSSMDTKNGNTVETKTSTETDEKSLKHTDQLVIPSGQEKIGRDKRRNTTNTTRVTREPKQNGEFVATNGPSKRKKILAESSERIKRMEEESDNEKDSHDNQPKRNRNINNATLRGKSNSQTGRSGRYKGQNTSAKRSSSSPRRSVRTSNKVEPSQSSDEDTASKDVDARPKSKKQKGHQKQAPTTPEPEEAQVYFPEVTNHGCVAPDPEALGRYLSQTRDGGIEESDASTSVGSTSPRLSGDDLKTEDDDEEVRATYEPSINEDEVTKESSDNEQSVLEDNVEDEAPVEVYITPMPDGESEAEKEGEPSTKEEGVVTKESSDIEQSVIEDSTGEDAPVEVYITPRSDDREATGKDKQQRTPRPINPNERAQLRRIRQMLKDATMGNDVYDLDEAIWHFEKNGLEDNGDLTDALERLDYLQLRLGLREAILRRHLGTLDRAIDEVINSEHEGKLRNLTKKAEELRDHLRALDRYSHDILDMDQKAISEIRTYCNPPPSVHEVMAACYMLLGTKEERLLEWPEIQSYVCRLGRDSLRKMIRNFDTDSVPVEVQMRVKEIISSYNLEEIRGVSNGVATFYIWAKNMIDLLDKRSLQDSGEDTERSKKG